MPVIKSNQVPTSVSIFSMADIEQQAQGILRNARKQADALVLDARRQSEALKASGYVEGFENGAKEGLEKGLSEGHAAGREEALNNQRQKLSDLVKALTVAATELDVHRRELEATALREVIDLSIAIATRVTKRQGVLDPQVALANVAEALKLAIASTDVRIGIHPSQKEIFDEVLPRLRVQWPNFKHIEIVEDASLAPGGCRVHSGSGQIDADLDGQLNRIAAELVPPVGEVLA